MTNGMRFVTEELLERDDALLTTTTRQGIGIRAVHRPPENGR